MKPRDQCGVGLFFGFFSTYCNHSARYHLLDKHSTEITFPNSLTWKWQGFSLGVQEQDFHSEKTILLIDSETGKCLFAVEIRAQFNSSDIPVP
jgi:hypothetical protein